MKILEMMRFYAEEQISPIEKVIQSKDIEIGNLKTEIQHLERQVEDYKNYAESLKHDREYWFDAYKKECHKRVMMEIEKEKEEERKGRAVVIRR